MDHNNLLSPFYYQSQVGKNVKYDIFAVTSAKCYFYNTDYRPLKRSKLEHRESSHPFRLTYLLLHAFCAFMAGILNFKYAV